ncbi:MAG: tyrosine-type recombinase/integrase [Methylococcales bacterium]|nr:tyrosine-type recombinase/integrase [Methylococcales bacterium]MDD5754365.1 tyrosine-type recombinase/integrase [Methylococcales bacterium]
MLTDIEIRKAKPKERPYKLSDSNGLHLLVNAQSKLWRYAYRFDGKQKTFAIGAYPIFSLNDARQKRDDAKKQLACGIDPSTAKRALKQTTHVISANSFEVIAREWHQTHMTTKTTDHAKKVLDRLENDVFAFIGHITIKEIEASDVLSLLRKIEQRGACDLAHMTKQIIGQVFRYAIATGREVRRNPVPDLEGALKPRTVTHYAAITEPNDIAELLRAIENYTGSIVTKCALKLACNVMLRPVEIRTAEWSEIDLERKEWRIPASKMKKRLDHVVPLSRQVIEIFKQLQPITGHRQFVFPNVRTPNAPMSENTINGALKRLGFGETMTAHGFRSMASTRLNESNLFGIDVIERQLAHNDKNAVRAAYNRAQYLPERVKMMQFWSDNLDGLRENSNIVSFQQARK